jgi:1,4-alpha-glucan branching enzyme
MSKVTLKRRRIIFLLEAPQAKEVVLMGDFNNWGDNIHHMNKDSNGVWSKIVLIPSGRYEYKFLVDGEWWHDPNNKEVCYNKHGTLNSIITVN